MRIISLALAALMLTACNSQPMGEPVDGQSKVGQKQDVSVWKDSNGCEYLIYSEKRTYAGMGGITARMGRDGRQICS